MSDIFDIRNKDTFEMRYVLRDVQVEDMEGGYKTYITKKEKVLQFRTTLGYDVYDDCYLKWTDVPIVEGE